MKAICVVLIVAVFDSAVECRNSDLENPEDYRWSIPYDELDMHALTSKNSSVIENTLYNSLQTTNNIFGDISPGLKNLALVTKLLPFVNEITDVVSSLAEIGSKETDWKHDFQNALNDQIEKQVTKGQVNGMSAFLKSVEQFLPLLEETIFTNGTEYQNEEDEENEISYEEKEKNSKGIATTLHANFNEFINTFTMPNSTFKHYPLIGATVLIEMGLAVSIFEPMALQFIPLQATRLKLSCKIRDTIMDYLPFIVDARLEKLNANLTNMVQVRNEPYNSTGYNRTSSLLCGESKDADRECSTLVDSSIVDNACLIDQFGTKEYNKQIERDNCEKGYAQYLRHLVEGMFPIDIVNKLCNRKSENTTGSGWATIKLKKLQALHLEKPTIEENKPGSYGWDMNSRVAENICDRSRRQGNPMCDPFVIMTIGEDEVLRTIPREDSQIFNVGRTITSDKIQKNSTIIKIEVWDFDGTDKKPELILMTNGTVDSFLHEAIRCTEGGKANGFGKKLKEVRPNCLEVDVLWQDERNEPKSKFKLKSTTTAPKRP